MNSSSFYIYNASAGSGKTYSLVKAYIAVLLQSKHREPFKNILAITFTNKAVAEMKDRIISSLRLFANSSIIESDNSMFRELCDELNLSPESLHSKSKSLLYSILKNYAAFDVSTIDRFTQKIIRTFAFDLKLPLNFEVELDKDSMLHEAVENLIARAGSDIELTKLLVSFALEKIDDDKSWDITFDFKKAANLLVNENNLPHLETLKNKTLKDFKALKANLKNQIKDYEKEIKKIAEEVLTLISESGLEHTDFSRSTLPNHFVKASQLSFYRLYDNKLEENIANRRGLYNKTLDIGLAEVIDAIIPEIETKYHLLKQNVYQHKFLSNFYLNSTPLSVLNLINNELSLLKEEQNTLLISEFNSIISKEVKNQPVPFIYERIGEKFKHFFIDEFQDTSAMQWENLIPLIDNALASENASAMLVGDAKQAIYRWRGGKAEQFIDLYNKTEQPFQVEAEIKNLSSNYRSSKTIVDFNNRFFSHLSTVVFSNDSHRALFENCIQNVESNEKGYVSINFLSISKDDDSNKLYPEAVLNQINKTLELGYKYGDICILVRHIKEGVAIANYLSENNVDFQSSETLALQRSEKVNFIINSLKYLQNPEDSITKIEVLNYLSTILNIKNKHAFFADHIHLNIKSFYKSFSEHDILFDVNEAIQLSIYELIEYIVYHFNLVNDSDAYVQALLNFTFNQTNKKSISLSDFLEFYDEKAESLKINGSHDENAVQIMTIHKSKGLEFPVVIFPYADLDIYKEREPKVWYNLDQEYYNGFSTTLLNYNKDFVEYSDQGSELYTEHQSNLELDNINLLYVALTRASKQLHIISEISFDSKGILRTKQNNYSGLLTNFLKNEGLWNDTKLHYSFGVEGNLKTTSSSDQSISTSKSLSIPRKEHQINIITKSGLLWDTVQKDAIEKGNLVHDIMAHIKTKADVEITITTFELNGVINNSQANELKNLVYSIIEHPKLKSYFSEDFTIYNERDIILKDGSTLRPDKLIINENNEVVIIDYKSGKPENKHKEQLMKYQDALEDMDHKVIKKILIYMNDQIELKEV